MDDKSKEGDMIIFPSHVLHYPPNWGNRKQSCLGTLNYYETNRYFTIKCARNMHLLQIQLQDETVEVDLTDQDLSKVYDVITGYAFNRVKLKGKLLRPFVMW